MQIIETSLQVLAMVVVLVGTAFSALGVLGLIRLPDVYTRMHATGKVGVFGVVLLAVAALILPPADAGKAVVLIVLLVVSAPVVSHSLGSAAYRAGIRMKVAIRDDLAQVLEGQEGQEDGAKTTEA